MLADFRNGLRQLVDPATGLPFTEDTLRRVTTKGSRFWTEADSIDVVGLGIQKRDEFLAQQMRIDRAGSAMLRNYHAELWGEVFLPAVGGSGFVLATGTAGTTWLGSTTLPDALATYGVDPAGQRYQVLVSGTANADGEVELLLIGIDGGRTTNIAVGTQIRWVNPPPGSAPTAAVSGDPFSGGSDAEDDAAFASRLGARVRHKPAAGNWSFFRTLARAASVAVEDAFVYCCAFNAGSVLVVPLQKRGDSKSPSARIPSGGTLTAVTSLLVPPNSPSIPGEVFVAVVAPQPVADHAVVKLSLVKGKPTGWTDPVPFPPANTSSGAVTITTLSSQTDFRITNALGAGLLPGGVSGPLAGIHLMVWDEATSTFEALDVSTVQDVGAGVYRVLLNTAPANAIALGDYVSPDMARRDVLAAAYVSYMDSLGPGEVVNLTSDPRSVRAYRNPPPSEEAPSRAGASLLTFTSDALGAPLADSSLVSILVSSPALPSDPIDGPILLVPGRFAAYALD